MADSFAKQISAALISRCAAIAGIGDTSIEPKAPSSITGFPAVFIDSDEEEKAARTMSSTGGSKTCELTVTLGVMTNDVEALAALWAVMKSIEDAIEASPYDLGVSGVLRPFVVGTKRLRFSDDNRVFGYGEVRVLVTYDQPYGGA
jgi:hypothetical protein